MPLSRFIQTYFMKKLLKIYSILLVCTGLTASAALAQSADLKIVFIRHAEKPLKGDNLSCQGLNRSAELPAVIHAKFGIPAYTFVPAIGLGEATKHSRMFQTIVPLAAKYNLIVNSSRQEKDSLGMAADLKSRSGTVLVVWEHNGIAPIVRALGINKTGLVWPDNDYDSIWIITFKNGKANMETDKENINPSTDCGF
ncbi:MAG: histidine phosphatase family protein [Mucilaginibacter sp.]|nr:histidine phosphatase family protein [Mucilaginibacter sp.]